MPWLRAGDNAATHPIVLKGGYSGGNINELFGFVMRCALQSAGHVTDYVIDQGTARLCGEGDVERLVKAAVKAGYLKPTRHEGERAWRLVEDPDFLHMRMRAEIDWEKQQRADSANTALTAPVRARDGDECRYCSQIVSWRARKGGRRGSYDHRPPGQAATVETLFVACGSCNSGRRDDPHAEDRYPLRPPPARPYYGPDTVKFLAAQGISVTPSDERPDPVSDNAPSDLSASEATHLSDPAASRATPLFPDGSADSSEPIAHVPGRVGFGSGSGQVRAGPGWDGSGSRSVPRKRSARGRPR